MEQAVSGYRVPAVVGSPSGEVGQASPGLLHDDERRREIPGIELRFEHRLAGAFSHQRVAPEIAEAAIPPRRAGHGVKAAFLADRNERRARGVEDLGILKLRDHRDLEPTLARPGAAA